MQWDILATILLTATIQSLFGVGVLLFATAILRFLATELLLYSRMSTERYRTTFAAFLFLSGTALIFKSIFLR